MYLERRGYWPTRTCLEGVGSEAEVVGPTQGMKGSGLISTRRRHATHNDSKVGLPTNKRGPARDGDDAKRTWAQPPIDFILVKSQFLESFSRRKSVLKGGKGDAETRAE